MESPDIAKIGTSKPVYALIFVAYDEKIAIPARKQANQLILRGIGILKLVYQNVLIALLIELKDVGVVHTCIQPLDV